MPSCHYRFTSIEVDPAPQDNFGLTQLQLSAESYARQAADYAGPISILLIAFLVVQVYLIIRVVKRRAATGRILMTMLTIGALAGPTSYLVLDFWMSIFDSALYSRCQMATTSAFNSLSWEHSADIDLIMTYGPFLQFLELYIIGVHGFLAAWSANSLIKKRLTSSAAG